MQLRMLGLCPVMNPFLVEKGEGERRKLWTSGFNRSEKENFSTKVSNVFRDAHVLIFFLCVRVFFLSRVHLGCAAHRLCRPYVLGFGRVHWCVINVKRFWA